MKNLLLKIEHLSMQSEGGLALSDLNLYLLEGELLGLAGLNGSGKTALARVLSGQAGYESGRIYLNGALVGLGSPKEARALGIYCIDHHIDLLMDFSVWENIRFPIVNAKKYFYVDRTADRRIAQDVIDLLELPLSIDAQGWQLTHAQKRFTQLAKAVASGARLLLLDNISNDFTERETRVFLRALRHAVQHGVSIMLISHRSDQLSEMDRVMVLRDGKYTGTIFKEDYEKEKLYSLMAGHVYQELLQRSRFISGETVLDVQDLSTPTIHSLSFSIRRGETLGITDLSDINISELLSCLMGDTYSSGCWIVDGKELSGLSVKELAQNGVGILTNQMVLDPLFPSLSVEENTVFLSFKRLASFGVFLKRRLWAYACRQPIQALGIDQRDARLPLGKAMLSKEQKIQIQLSRWSTVAPKLLICLELTQELDVFAKMRIWDQIKRLNTEGMAILFISSDLSELSALCDRTIIMDNGYVLEAASDPPAG